MNEEVFAINRKYLPDFWQKERMAIFITKEDINLVLEDYKWLDRSFAESNTHYKQIIPYLIICSKNDKKIAVYRRTGNEKRLHGLYSIGVGGHINPVDKKEGDKPSDTIIRSAYRELNEEIAIVDKKPNLLFKGLINEEITEVGKVHTGLVFKIELAIKPEPLDELSDMQWVSKEIILKNFKLELWSKLALEVL